MNSYHFDCGNSADGPIGFCARVKAETPAEAVDKLNAALDKESGGIMVYDDQNEDPETLDGIEYVEIYLGKVTEENINEVDEDIDEDEEGEGPDFSETRSVGY